MFFFYVQFIMMVHVQHININMKLRQRCHYFGNYISKWLLSWQKFSNGVQFIKKKPSLVQVMVLSSNRWQTTTWTNDAPDLWCLLQWLHNGRDGISNHQPHDCLLYRLFRHISKKISKLRVTGLCVGNSSVTGEFPAQMASNVENVSIWWRHHNMASLGHS